MLKVSETGYTAMHVFFSALFSSVVMAEPDISSESRYVPVENTKLVLSALFPSVMSFIPSRSVTKYVVFFSSDELSNERISVFRMILVRYFSILGTMRTCSFRLF